jgi:hypothetical protein
MQRKTGTNEWDSAAAVGDVLETYHADRAAELEWPARCRLVIDRYRHAQKW